jgi:predicted dehydrogenase
MEKEIRWGILGVGRIADKFCTALIATPRATLYAVASRNVKTGKAFATKFNASVYYDNYLDLVSDPNVDVIYIATPHVFHYEQTFLCLNHNKPVLCEKPMSISLQHTQEMIALAQKNNLFLMEAIWTVCMPFIQKIKEIIGEGIIGSLQYVQADFGFSTPFDADSRLFNKALGGGSILDVGVYPISLATLLLGEPSSIKSLTKLSSTEIDEYANIILQYSNGSTAHLFSAITTETPIEAIIIGTKGKIKVGSPWYMATDFTLLNDGTSKSYSIPHPTNGFEYEIIEVMNCLDKGILQSPLVPHHQTLTVSKIMDELLKQAGIDYTIT